MSLTEKMTQEKYTGKAGNQEKKAGGKKTGGKNGHRLEAGDTGTEVTRIEEIRWELSIRSEVWKKGRHYVDYSPKVLRLDRNGRIMMYSKFGRTDSKFGWTIEMIDPSKEIKPIDLDNLEPVNIGYTDQ